MVEHPFDNVFTFYYYNTPIILCHCKTFVFELLVRSARIIQYCMVLFTYLNYKHTWTIDNLFSDTLKGLVTLLWLAEDCLSVNWEKWQV